VRYVNVYDYHLDYVTFGYLPGYTGTYVDGPTIVYGTGYTYPGWYGTAYFPPPLTWGFGAYYDPFAYSWGFDLGLYWYGPGWFAYPWHERWWHDHPHEHWGAHRWWGPGGFEHSHDIRGHLADGRDHGFNDGGHDSKERMPGAVHRGAGWNNIYARDGNTARNISSTRQRPATPARVVGSPRDNVFAGSNGQVYRRSATGWEQHSGGAWSGTHSVPDAHPSYRPPAIVNHAGAGFAAPRAGLDQHFAARSRGSFRSAPNRSFGGGGFHGGSAGGFHGGGGGGFHGGGGGGGHR
jgi:uncharacterized membrane protein YgcG